MKFLRWERGRQVGNYSKLALFPQWLSILLSADAYILRFPDKCSVIKHKDPVLDGHKHIRVNVILKRPDNLRQRMYILGPIKRWWRFEMFRPDLYEHGLEPISGSMVMLSFGFRIKE